MGRMRASHLLAALAIVLFTAQEALSGSFITLWSCDGWAAYQPADPETPMTCVSASGQGSASLSYDSTYLTALGLGEVSVAGAGQYTLHGAVTASVHDAPRPWFANPGDAVSVPPMDVTIRLSDRLRFSGGTGDALAVFHFSSVRTFSRVGVDPVPGGGVGLVSGGTNRWQCVGWGCPNEGSGTVSFDLNLPFTFGTDLDFTIEQNVGVSIYDVGTDTYSAAALADIVTAVTGITFTDTNGTPLSGVVIEPASAETPEPSTALLVAAVLGLVATCRWRL